MALFAVYDPNVINPEYYNIWQVAYMAANFVNDPLYVAPQPSTMSNNIFMTAPYQDDQWKYFVSLYTSTMNIIKDEVREELMAHFVTDCGSCNTFCIGHDDIININAVLPNISPFLPDPCQGVLSYYFIEQAKSYRSHYNKKY